MQEVSNVRRSVGARLSGELIRRNPEGLPDHTVFIQMEGTGGQSFGAFLAQGITFYLIGDANDYTGKGLSGRASTSGVMRRRTSSSATPRSTARPGARPSSAAWRVSVSQCACRARRRSSKAQATMAAST